MAAVIGSLLFLTLCNSVLVYAKVIWSTKPANNYTDLIRTAYPIGNGQLAVLPYGEPGCEKLNLNKDTLWSGGPFENSSYTGANPTSWISSALPGIVDWIFRNGTGNVTALQTDSPNYGNYYVLGNVSVSIPSLVNGTTTGYKRVLDLETGVHTTTFTKNGASYLSNIFCSYPDSVCVYSITSNATLPSMSIGFENQLSNSSLVNASCSASGSSALFSGTTQADIGMLYKAQARVLGAPNMTCQNGVLTVKPTNQSMALVISAGTNYNISRGTSADDFSFRGEDPSSVVSRTAAAAASKSITELLEYHVADFIPLMQRFALNLPDILNSSQVETADAIAAYGSDTTDISHTDTYLESLQFDFGRYLFISSSRPGSLPPNLQGKWAYGIENAWSADYHTDINLQMNHWGVDQTGLGDLQEPLWTYMTQGLVPRGSESAKLIYGSTAEDAWVIGPYVNVFGATGMNMGDDYWSDYPAAAAWLMLQVADHWSYSQDRTWLNNTALPLLLGVTDFWLGQLRKDTYFNDGTYVVNPCDSPEHGPTTFGCTNYQQLLYSLFSNTVDAMNEVGHSNNAYRSSIYSAMEGIDHGLHIGSWGQIQEWKLDLDVQNDTHRHLSNLIGWFPGSSMSGYQGGYTNSTIQNAVDTTLWSRGPGIADSNAGWEKVWRAACWARLNDTERAYYELRLTMQQNFADNMLSMYSGKNEPFQIDANFGYVGAVLSMLVVDLPSETGLVVENRTVVLGPAVPSAWAGGSVKGLRIRGGGIVDFSWNDEGVVDTMEIQQITQGVPVNYYNKEGTLLKCGSCWWPSGMPTTTRDGGNT